MSEWKPGDVAMVQCSDGEWRRAMFVDNHNWPEWRFADGLLRKAYDSPVRPLVVADPEDREQVEQLVTAYDGNRSADAVPVMQAALRSLIATEVTP